jgi:hypothetical protein
MGLCQNPLLWIPGQSQSRHAPAPLSAFAVGQPTTPHTSSDQFRPHTADLFPLFKMCHAHGHRGKACPHSTPGRSHRGSQPLILLDRPSIPLPTKRAAALSPVMSSLLPLSPGSALTPRKPFTRSPSSGFPDSHPTLLPHPTIHQAEEQSSKRPNKTHGSRASAANASGFIHIPLSQVPRRETLGSTRTLGAGALVDRRLRFYRQRSTRRCHTI